MSGSWDMMDLHPALSGTQRHDKRQPMNRSRLMEILEDVRAGHVTPADAAAAFRDLQTEDLGYASVDHHRAVRIGFPEVIFGQGKSPAQILGIFTSLKERQEIVLITRVDDDKAATVLREFPDLDHNATARTLLWKKGEMNAETIRQEMTALISKEPLANIEYVSIADAQTVEELSKIDRPALASLAVKIGKTRLIDNVIMEVE